jgi:hypothetical protein
MVNVKTKFGSFKPVGFESIDVHFPIENKPRDGFVYVIFKDGDLGAMPKSDVLNWHELPSHVRLSEELKKKREKHPDYIKVISNS